MKKIFEVNDENMAILDGYFRASNYLSAAQIYLKRNALLAKPLTMADIKTKLVGHWGTVPGQNFIYTHLDRAICKYNLDMIYISGPGHGGNFFISNSYLEGHYSEVYPNIPQTAEGIDKLCKQFSFPGGVSSHVAPQLPGSIHEGGELGYSLMHAFGAVLDNPNLICACVIGDGEAETGPLATSWHGNKFINPITDGAVLPILHLNGYKINNPTVLARINKNELAMLLRGYGYKPYFVEGSNVEKMHKLMANTIDAVIEEIKQIQEHARKTKDAARPVWPMIVLKTPKGWTGPKQVDGKKIEGTFRAHQVPMQIEDAKDLKHLENWLKSYRPKELFDQDGKLRDIYRTFIPKNEKRMSANPHANGGLLLKDLQLPNLECCEVKISQRGAVEAQDMLELGKYIKKVYEENAQYKNFRIFSPDEAMSNRLYAPFEVENRQFNGKILPDDDKLSNYGRIMDSYLSEHMCEGWLEGYLLTGRHGVFASYEAFIRVVDSMISQFMKWIKECSHIKFRKKISSLNLILTSNVWQQDHNGFTHQDPGLLDHMCSKESSLSNIYLPPDANSLIACFDKALRSRSQINTIVASKHPSYQWLTMKEAIAQTKKGINIWDWASNNDDGNPDIVLACAGDTPTKEVLACAKILKERLPKLKFRVVNVLNLMTLDMPENHVCGISDEEFDRIFTKDKPIIFNFHGYPKLIHQLAYKRHNQEMHVHGYREIGRITTPFDMRVLNKIDRFNLVKDVIKYVPKLKDVGQQLYDDMNYKLIAHKKYITNYGVDMPEIRDWKW